MRELANVADAPLAEAAAVLRDGLLWLTEKDASRLRTQRFYPWQSSPRGRWRRDRPWTSGSAGPRSMSVSFYDGSTACSPLRHSVSGALWGFGRG